MAEGLSRHNPAWNPRASLAALLVAALTLLLAGGCGLSGGSVPIGRPGSSGTGRVSGTVVRASTLTTPLEGVTVTVVDASGQVHTTVTDSAGEFAIEGLAPGPAAVSALREPAGPLPAEPAEGVQLEINVQEGKPTSMVLAVTPVSPVSGVPDGSLESFQGPLTLHVGEQKVFPNRLLGTAAPVAPSWVAEGGVGVVEPGGVFRATHPGTGVIRAVVPGAEFRVAVTVLPASAEVLSVVSRS